jgi:hypothetical protein
MSDIYGDGFNLNINTFDVHVDLMLTTVTGERGITGRVRLPFGLAKLLAIALKRTLVAHEEKNGEIGIPEEKLKEAGISLAEDW